MNALPEVLREQLQAAGVLAVEPAGDAVAQLVAAAEGVQGIKEQHATEELADMFRAVIRSWTPACTDRDPFDRVVSEILELNKRKRSDYASTDDPFSNFRRTAEQTGLPPGQVVEVLIGVKQARLRELSDGRTPNNESIRDTLIDRAVYSIIRLAMHDQEENS